MIQRINGKMYNIVGKIEILKSEISVDLNGYIVRSSINGIQGKN
jgi:hypothetical protein